MWLEDSLKTLFWYLIYIAVALVLLASMPALSQGSVSKHQNGLGPVIPDDNPWVYLLALPVDGNIVQQGNHIATNVRFRPYGTDLLLTAQVLFCGDVRTLFGGKSGVLILTYRRQATTNFGGVACHDLLSVFEVPAPKMEIF